VFLTALQLLDDAVQHWSEARGKLVPRDLQHRLDPMAQCLVVKLGDNQPRVREAALDALLALASAPPVGCGFVVYQATRKLPKRQTGKVWRPLASRLQLLRDLVDEYGVPGGGVSLEAATAFVKENEATSHTSQEVRDAARELMVSLYRRLGPTADWEPVLVLLRNKQREEYERAFEDCGETENAAAHLPRGSDQESTMAYDKSKELVVGAAEAKSGPTYGSTGSPTSRARTGDQIKDEDDEDENVEAFKDNIMKQLEESAFSIEEAHNILAIHFGSTTGDPVKDVVLAEWCGEVGISKPVAEMKVEERLDALDKVAKWLFQ